MFLYAYMFLCCCMTRRCVATTTITDNPHKCHVQYHFERLSRFTAISSETNVSERRREIFRQRDHAANKIFRSLTLGRNNRKRDGVTACTLRTVGTGALRLKRHPERRHNLGGATRKTRSEPPPTYGIHPLKSTRTAHWAVRPRSLRSVEMTGNGTDLVEMTRDGTDSVEITGNRP